MACNYNITTPADKPGGFLTCAEVGENWESVKQICEDVSSITEGAEAFADGVTIQGAGTTADRFRLGDLDVGQVWAQTTASGTPTATDVADLRQYIPLVVDGTTITGSGTAADPWVANLPAIATPSFLQLTDTPSAYTSAGQLVAINGAGDGLAFVDAPAGTLFDLTDTNINNPADGDKLTYDLDAGEWVNSPAIWRANPNTGGTPYIWYPTSLGTALFGFGDRRPNGFPGGNLNFFGLMNSNVLYTNAEESTGKYGVYITGFGQGIQPRAPDSGDYIVIGNARGSSLGGSVIIGNNAGDSGVAPIVGENLLAVNIGFECAQQNTDVHPDGVSVNGHNYLSVAIGYQAAAWTRDIDQSVILGGAALENNRTKNSQMWAGKSVIIGGRAARFTDPNSVTGNIWFSGTVMIGYGVGMRQNGYNNLLIGPFAGGGGTPTRPEERNNCLVIGGVDQSSSSFDDEGTISYTSDIRGAFPTRDNQIFFGSGGLNSGNTYLYTTVFWGVRGAMTMPHGTTAQRPPNPDEGMFRYNAELFAFEGYFSDTGDATGLAWRPFGGGGSGAATFIDLTDTPNALGTPGQIPQVNSAGNALEFVDPPSGGGAASYLDLTDTPTGFNAGFYPRVNSQGNAIIFQDGIPFADLTGVPSYATNFLDLADTPGAYGAAGKLVAINSAGDGLVFVDPPSGGGGAGLWEVSSSIPEPYINPISLRKVVIGATTLAFPGGTNFLPSNPFLFVSPPAVGKPQAAFFGGAVTIQTNQSSFVKSMLVYRDNQYTGGSNDAFVFGGPDRGNAETVNNSFIFGQTQSNSGATSSINNTIVIGQADLRTQRNNSIYIFTDNYRNSIGGRVIIGNETSRIFWMRCIGSVVFPKGTTAQAPTGSDVEPGSMRFNTEDNLFYWYRTDAEGWVPIPIGGGGSSTFISLTDTPGSFGAPGQLLQVNASGNALEFVNPPSGGGGSSTFLGLTDTPNSWGTNGQVPIINNNALVWGDLPSSGGGDVVSFDGTAVVGGEKTGNQVTIYSSDAGSGISITLGPGYQIFENTAPGIPHDISGITNGQILAWNNNQFLPIDPPSGGGADTWLQDKLNAGDVDVLGKTNILRLGTPGDKLTLFGANAGQVVLNADTEVIMSGTGIEVYDAGGNNLLYKLPTTPPPSSDHYLKGGTLITSPDDVKNLEWGIPPTGGGGGCTASLAQAVRAQIPSSVSFTGNLNTYVEIDQLDQLRSDSTSEWTVTGGTLNYSGGTNFYFYSLAIEVSPVAGTAGDRIRIQLFGGNAIANKLDFLPATSGEAQTYFLSGLVKMENGDSLVPRMACSGAGDIRILNITLELYSACQIGGST